MVGFDPNLFSNRTVTTISPPRFLLFIFQMLLVTSELPSIRSVCFQSTLAWRRHTRRWIDVDRCQSRRAHSHNCNVAVDRRVLLKSLDHQNPRWWRRTTQHGSWCLISLLTRSCDCDSSKKWTHFHIDLLECWLFFLLSSELEYIVHSNHHQWLTRIFSNTSSLVIQVCSTNAKETIDDIRSTLRCGQIMSLASIYR